MSDNDYAGDKVARFVAAADQLGAVIRPLAELLGGYDRALQAAGMDDAQVCAGLLLDAQQRLWTGRPE